MRLFTENPFDVDNALKSWLEKAAPTKSAGRVRVNQMGGARISDWKSLDWKSPTLIG
jgi:hypothetical protein